MNIQPNNNKSKKRQLSVSAFHKIGRDAYLDWALSISFSFVLLVALVTVAYLAYDGTSVLKTSSRNAQTAVQKSIFDEQALNNILTVYENREDERARLEKGYSGIGDPSI